MWSGYSWCGANFFLKLSEGSTRWRDFFWNGAGEARGGARISGKERGEHEEERWRLEWGGRGRRGGGGGCFVSGAGGAGGGATCSGRERGKPEVEGFFLKWSGGSTRWSVYVTLKLNQYRT